MSFPRRVQSYIARHKMIQITVTYPLVTNIKSDKHFNAPGYIPIRFVKNEMLL